MAWVSPSISTVVYSEIQTRCVDVLTSWESVKEKCKLKILAAQCDLIRVLQYLSEGDRSVRGTPSLNP